MDDIWPQQLMDANLRLLGPPINPFLLALI